MNKIEKILNCVLYKKNEMKLEMENNQIKIKRKKKNKNEKELIWAWMKWGFKRKMGISYWVFELWVGLEWTGGKWIKARK